MITANDVSLIKDINWLKIAGSIDLMACGNTIIIKVCTYVKPEDIPASVCPIGTAFNPARKISDNIADSKIVNAATAAQKYSI